MANGSQKIPFVRDQGSARQNYTEFTDGDLLVRMIREDLIAQRITIDGCRDIIHYLRDHDALTCRRLAAILVLNGERATDVENHSESFSQTATSKPIVNKKLIA